MAILKIVEIILEVLRMGVKIRAKVFFFVCLFLSDRKLKLLELPKFNMNSNFMVPSSQSNREVMGYLALLV